MPSLILGSAKVGGASGETDHPLSPAPGTSISGAVKRPRPPHGTGIYLALTGAAPQMLKGLGCSGVKARGGLGEGYRGLGRRLTGRHPATASKRQNGPLSAGIRVASEGGAPLPRDSCLRAAHWSQPCPRLAQHRPKGSGGSAGQRVCKGPRGCVAARDRKRDGQFFVPRQVQAYQERPRPPHGTGAESILPGVVLHH